MQSTPQCVCTHRATSCRLSTIAHTGQQIRTLNVHTRIRRQERLEGNPQLPRNGVTCISRLHEDTTEGRGRSRAIARRRRRACVRPGTPHRALTCTRAPRKHPPRQPIRNVADIAVRRPQPVPQVSAGGDAAGIVHPRRAVVCLLLAAVRAGGCVAGGELIHRRRQAVPRPGSADAVEEHVGDCLRGAGGGADAGVGAGVRLHEARVGVGAVGGLDADAAFGFLHHLWCFVSTCSDTCGSSTREAPPRWCASMDHYNQKRISGTTSRIERPQGFFRRNGAS